ncbi:NAD(P)/FAD-dependent oxidoreductase [Flavitalea sp.]|nr:FAD-dependent oxidoreductase [Flavitalea sp.]
MTEYSKSLSIWEKECFSSNRDIIIIGAGLSGLWSAFHLKKIKPSLSITIIERGLIPSGASTRNAGFACFGSLTELLHDVELMGADKMLQLVGMRYQGLQQIMKTFNPAETGFSLCGGYELVTDKKVTAGRSLHDGMKLINQLLASVVPTHSTFSFSDDKINEFGFGNVDHLIENPLEGYLHPGKLCQVLTRCVQAAGVTILNGINVNGYTKSGGRVILHTNKPYEFSASNLLVCTNAFAGSLLPGIDIVQARGQVLLTNEITNLKFRGTFHADEGFYYFRNHGNRILLGGARNEDFDGETSGTMETTSNIQAALEQFLEKYIIPSTPFSISDRWSGIMAMGKEKLPIVKEIEPSVFCSVRMSGMGVALTPVTGETIAKMMLS